MTIDRDATQPPSGQMTKQRKLAPKAQALLDAGATPEQRIQHIRKDFFLPYARATAIMKEMEELLAAPRVIRPDNIMIVANPNSGKTALLRKFHDKHQPKERLEHSAMSMPVVYFESPPACSIAMFQDEFMAAMRMDVRRTDNKTQSIVQHLEKVDNKIVLLDEVHNLFVGGGPTVQRQMQNLIRGISNKSRSSFVLAGTPEAVPWVNNDKQFKWRFPIKLLKRWKVDDEDYIAFLKGCEMLMPLHQPSGLHRHSAYIYKLTEGSLGNIVKLIRRSAIAAIELNDLSTEFISKALLAQCAEIVIDVGSDELLEL